MSWLSAVSTIVMSVSGWMQFDAMELDKALARMDASLHEAFAAKSDIELLLQAKDEHRPPDAGETETLRDRYHDIALSNEALHVNPMDMPKKDGTTDSNNTSVVFVRGWCGRCTPIIHPDHFYLLPWILLGALFIAYDLLVMPYRLCFSAPAEGASFIFEWSFIWKFSW